MFSYFVFPVLGSAGFERFKSLVTAVIPVIAVVPGMIMMAVVLLIRRVGHGLLKSPGLVFHVRDETLNFAIVEPEVRHYDFPAHFKVPFR